MKLLLNLPPVRGLLVAGYGLVYVAALAAICLLFMVLALGAIPLEGLNALVRR